MVAEITYRSRVNLLAGAWGAAAVVVQTEYLRAVMASSAGGTLGVGAVLGAWLAAIALGAAAGGWLARRSARPVIAADMLALLAPFAATFGLFYLASLRTVADVPTGELIPLGALVVHGALACLPFALLVGAGFPVLARLASSRDIASHDPAAFFIGGVWAGEALGAFAGGVAFTFLLAGRCGPALNVLAAALVPLLATWLLPDRRAKPLSAVRVVLAVAVAGALLSGGYLDKFHAARCWSSMDAPGELLESRWSRYSYLVLAELSGQRTLYENGQPELNFPDRWSDAASVSLLLSQHPDPRRVLVIGPAAYGPAQALLAAGVKQVTGIYPDPEQERMLLRHLPEEMIEPLRAGYSHVTADPRDWLRSGQATQDGGWDVIWLNVAGPMQMNYSRYFTPSFFRLVQRAFSPTGGVLAMRFPTAANAALPAQRAQAAAIFEALRSVFPSERIALSPTECYVFASNRDSLTSDSLQTLMGRVARYEGKVEGLSRYQLQDCYDRERIESFLRSVQDFSGEVHPHTDSTPAAWFQHILLWSRIAGSGGHREGHTGLAERALDLAGNINGIRAAALFPLLITFLLLGLWLLPAGSARSGGGQLAGLAALTVAVAGFAAMEVTISMVYLCQILFGALFHQVAMISATFMLALAAGSWWSSRRVPRDDILVNSLVVLLVLAAATAAAPVMLANLADSLLLSSAGWALAAVKVLFYMTLLVTGIVCGAIFPWAAAIHSRGGRLTEPSGTAAGLDAADHAGATIAAAVAGAVLIPAQGLAVAGLGTGAMVLCVALFWALIVVKL